MTGEVKENVNTCDILFASKDSLYRDETLNLFGKEYFDYIIVDEVHHGEAPTYRKILDYFQPKFLLGMTATPERTDRKDILALFDYCKICEYDINDAIVVKTFQKMICKFAKNYLGQAFLQINFIWIILRLWSKKWRYTTSHIIITL